jgi:hypothetical protein
MEMGFELNVSSTHPGEIVTARYFTCPILTLGGNGTFGENGEPLLITNGNAVTEGVSGDTGWS